MKNLKHETLSIRTTSEIKRLIQQIAAKEHRSVASMIEILILKHAQAQGIAPESAVSKD